MRRRRFALSAFLSIALVIGLCPGLALAAVQEDAVPNAPVQESQRAQDVATQDAAGDDAVAQDSAGDADTPLAATASVKAQGKWNTCKWELSNDGTLTIHAGTGADVGSAIGVPWKDHANSVKKLVIKEKVIAPADCTGLFEGYHNLVSADLSGLNTANVEKMGSMFSSCQSLTSLNLSGFNTSKVKNMSLMFAECLKLGKLTLGSSFTTANVTNMSRMFMGCQNLTQLDVSRFKTSNVIDMSQMFARCSNLESLNVSNFDTSKVTTMTGMFFKCEMVPSLDLSGFNTANVRYMNTMFSDCPSLTSIKFGSKFSTANVLSMNAMFSGCASLPSIDLSRFDTSKVMDMSSMFAGCKSVTSLDVSKFKTSNVNTMAAMFSGCSDLASIDLSKFDTTKANVHNILGECGSLKKLVLGTKTVNMDIPDTRVDKHINWFSQGAKQWFSPSQIESKRLGTADTYTKYSPDDIPDPEVKVMYRVYNPNSGEHFYTASANERDTIVKAGWRYEGTAWSAPSESKTPVYRLYSGTDHHYTTSAQERDSLVKVGWKYEGIAWYSDDDKGEPLLRLFNPNVEPTAPRNNSGSHHYTTSMKERDNLVNVGWRYEGLAWYGL